MFVNSTTKHMLNTVHSVVVRLFCLLAAWCPVLSPSVRPPTFWRVFRSRAEKPCANTVLLPYPWVLWMGAWGRDRRLLFWVGKIWREATYHHVCSYVLWNQSILNIIRWDAGPMGQKTRRPSVWRSKYFFHNFL